MVFTTAGGGANQLDTGYEIDNSLRFNDGDSPSLQFTPSSDSNEQTWTVSFWVKRGVIGTSSSQMIFMTDTNLSEYIFARFCGTEVTGKEDMFQVFMVEPNAREGDVRTARLFRDVSAWYHIVVRCDLTQSTAANRLRIYVNGVEETSFDTASYLNQNDDNINWNSNVKHAIGHQVQSATTERFLDGYLAEFYNIDGQSLGPDSFGETNDNGVWIPKDAKNDLTFGTNGFYLEFQQTGTGTNASGMGADTSGNDNHLAVNNLAAIDVTTDTPTNNFATLNSLSNFEGSTLSEGNTKAVTPSSSTTPANKNGLVPATMGVQNGKWYWEVKVPTTNYVAVGIIADDKLDKDYLTGANSSTRIVKGHDGTKHSSNSAGGNYMAAYEGSILQVALNLDDGEITFGAGGSWANGSGSTNQTFANSTAAYTDLNTSSDFTNKFILPVVSDENQGTSDTFEMNFGNPPFAISSSNADANGYGNFEYAVPSGYYSLCTKNLAEYG